MRDILLLMSTAAGVCVSLYYPFAGVLLWTWFSIMSPQSETFGIAQILPLNLAVAAAAITGWLVSREPKAAPNDPLVWFCGIFLIWCTLNLAVAADPAWSLPYWDRTWKIFALGLVVSVMARSRSRIHALLWVIVISLFYYGVKGAIFTIITGGGSHVYGPPGTIIGDNNQLALALLMALPLANFLRNQSTNRWITGLLTLAMGLTVVAVLGTYSRGGFIGLAVLLVAAWWHSRKKLLYLVAVAAVLVPALMFMPDSFFARLHSINSYGSDSSFQGRVMAWRVAFDYARDHFPFGAGFYGPQLAEVFHTYFPQEFMRAAHSIYFQVLGEQGFVGLALYLMIIGLAFIKVFKIRRIAAASAEGRWAAELANMTLLSLLVFYVCGAALSMAYYDVFVLLLGMLLALQTQLSPQSRAVALAPGMRVRFAAE